MSNQNNKSDSSEKIANFYFLQKQATSYSSIRSVDEGKKVLRVLIDILIRSYATQITEGLENTFRNYTPMNLDADCKIFLRERGDKQITVVNTYYEGFPILPKTLNKIFALTVTDWGIWLLRNFKIPFRDLLKSFFQPDVSRRKRINRGMIMVHSLREWWFVLHRYRKHKGVMLGLHPSDVSPEIIREFNDFLKHELGPRRFRDLAQKTLEQKGHIVLERFLLALRNAIAENGILIESNHYTQEKSKKANLLSRLYRIVIPPVKNMTPDSLIHSLVKGIEKVEDRIAYDAIRNLSCPDHRMVLKAFDQLNKKEFIDFFIQTITAKVRSSLNPTLSVRIDPTK